MLFALYWQSKSSRRWYKLLSPTPRRCHSIHKSSSARSNLTIFAPEGIFCDVSLPCVLFKCIQELTRNAYDNLNYRSEKRLKRLQNDSTIALISFTKVAREAGAISFWLVYSSNITVCEAIALSEGEININKTSRSFFAA